MKFFHYNKQEETFYLAEWKTGYIQLFNQWDQIRYSRFNWITFVLLQFEIERELGGGFTVELGFLGFRLTFYWLWQKSKLMKQLEKTAKAYRSGKLKGVPWEEFKKKLK